MSYGTSANNRQLLITPYTPDRTELIGNNTKQASYLDIGKPVKLSGDGVVLCADGDDIYGFIASVEAGSKGGKSYGAVACDAGREAIAIDEAGGLAVGGLVVAGTAVAFGATGIANVKTGSPSVHRWIVIGTEVSPSTAGKEVLLRKL